MYFCRWGNDLREVALNFLRRFTEPVRARARVQARIPPSDTLVLSHPWNWPPAAVLESRDQCVHTWVNGHQPHALSFQGRGIMNWGVSVFAATVCMSHIFLNLCFSQCYWNTWAHVGNIGYGVRRYHYLTEHGIWRQSCVLVQNLRHWSNCDLWESVFSSVKGMVHTFVGRLGGCDNL